MGQSEILKNCFFHHSGCLSGQQKNPKVLKNAAQSLVYCALYQLRHFSII